MEENQIKIFISYAHESDDYKQWVKSLADKLLNNGIEVILDQYDLKLTDKLPEFMEKNITDSKFVIILLSDNYIKKANERTGGVGYEVNITTGEIFVKNFRAKYIPILIKKDFTEVPTFLLGSNILKIENLYDYDQVYLELYSYITNQPIFQKPEIGKIIPIDELKEALLGLNPPVNEYCKKYGLPSYINTRAILRLKNLEGKPTQHVFSLIEKHFLKRRSDNFHGIRYFPHIVNPQYRTRVTPIVEYQTPNYIPLISNWKLTDRLVFSKNILQYDSIELSDERNPFLTYTSRIPLLSILYLFKTLDMLYKAYQLPQQIDIEFSIHSDKNIIYSENKEVIIRNLFNAEYNRFESYALSPENSSFTQQDFNFHKTSLRYFFDSCLGLFTSDNPKSTIPFLKIKDNDFDSILESIESGNYEY